MTADPVPVLTWPAEPPCAGRVRLRAFRTDDVPMVRDLATDPYLPLIGTLPARADEAGATAWIGRQHGRLREGRGFSFCVADAGTDAALGTVGLWTPYGVAAAVGSGRVTIGYAVAPRARGRHVARDAVAAVLVFGWTLSWVHRIEAYVEPGNTASRRSVEAAGFAAEGLLRSHQPIGGVRRDLVLYAALRPGP